MFTTFAIILINLTIMEKKYFVFMLLALATVFTACGSSDDEEEVLDKKEQVTTSLEQDVFGIIGDRSFDSTYHCSCPRDSL